MNKSGTLDMTKGSPIRLMLRFAVPMMIGSAFQSLYSMVDTIVLGRFAGAEAVAAIGATLSTVNFLLLFSTAATSAISIILSQYYGSHDEEGMRKGIAAAAQSAIMIGVVLGALGIVLARPIMRLLDTPDNIIDGSVMYIRIICGVCIAQFTYNAASSVLRAVGDSKTPLYFLIICSLLNVVFDLISVVWLKLGVVGVASATVISQAISAIACVLYMSKKYPWLMFTKRHLRSNGAVLKKVFSLGGQMAFQSAFLSVGMMVITRVINGFGSDVVAAFTVGSNVENLAAMLFSNFAFGFSVYVGQNYGAKRADRINLGVRQIFLLLAVLTIIASVLVKAFAAPLVSLYIKTDEALVREASLSFVRIQSWFFPFLGWIWLYNSSLRGMGKISITMISSFVELFSKIGFSLLLPIYMGYTGIWFSAPLGWILGIIPSAAYFYSGRWKKALSE